MRQALNIQAILMVVLVVAEIVAHRPIWRSTSAVLYAAGALMIVVYFMVGDAEINDGWAAFITVALILKNMSLTGQLVETFKRKVPARIPVAYSEASNGQNIVSVVDSLRSGIGRLAGRRSAQETPRNGPEPAG